MKGEHCKACVIDFPTCKCNSCKHDYDLAASCCFCNFGYDPCPVDDCPDYEPDDEEEGDEKCEN